jgi:hypothetical protein
MAEPLLVNLRKEYGVREPTRTVVERDKKRRTRTQRSISLRTGEVVSETVITEPGKGKTIIEEKIVSPERQAMRKDVYTPSIVAPYSSTAVSQQLGLVKQVEKKPLPYKDVYTINYGGRTGELRVKEVTQAPTIASPAKERYTVGSAIRSVDSSVGRFYQENILSPLISLEGKKGFKTIDTSKSRQLINIKVPTFISNSIKVAEEELVYNPQRYIAGRGAYKILGTGVSKVKPLVKVLSTTKGKVLGGTLLGAYIGGTAVKVAKSEDKGGTLTKELIYFQAATSGFKAGFKPSTKGLFVNTKKPVETLEFVKTTSKSKDFGDNILELYRGKPTVFSGGVSTKGGGLFKVGGREYRVLFSEKGLVRNVGNDMKFTRARATLNIQPYGSTVSGKKLPTGRLRKAVISSEQVTVPREDDILIKGISKIKSSNVPGITRLTLAKGMQTTDTTTFKGVSVDTFRGKALPDSRKLFKGTIREVLSATKDNVKYTVSSGNIFGRSLKKTNDLEFDVLKNVKRFNRKQFLSSGNGLVQTTTTSSVSSPSLVSQQSLKDVVRLEAGKDIARSNIQMFRSTASPISITKTKTTTSTPSTISISNLKLSTPKSVTKTFTTTIPKTTTKTIVGSKLKPLQKQDSLSKTLSMIIPKTTSMLKQNMRVDLGIKQKSMLRQQVMQRQVLSQTNLRGYGFSNIRTPRIPILGIPDVDFKFKQKPTGFKGLTLKPIVRRYKYSPNVEASYFKIKGKKPSKGLIESGLVLRPLRGKL